MMALEQQTVWQQARMMLGNRRRKDATLPRQVKASKLLRQGTSPCSSQRLPRNRPLCRCPPRTLSPTDMYTPTNPGKFVGGSMTEAPVKIRNFTTKQRIFMRKEELGKDNLPLSFSNLFFLSFKVVV